MKNLLRIFSRVAVGSVDSKRERGWHCQGYPEKYKRLIPLQSGPGPPEPDVSVCLEVRVLLQIACFLMITARLTRNTLAAFRREECSVDLSVADVIVRPGVGPAAGCFPLLGTAAPGQGCFRLLTSGFQIGGDAGRNWGIR